MPDRKGSFGWGLAAIIAASLLAYLIFNHDQHPPAAAVVPPPAVKPSEAAQSRPGILPKPNQKLMDASSGPVVRINPKTVLATVNGKELRLADLVPLTASQMTNDQEFPAVAYKYLLDRAINRELILQTAKQQGISLDDSQKEQLAEFRRQRDMREPGLVQQINGDASRVDFEVRDAEAFALQTSLLAKIGATPDVTSSDVQDYYSQHSGDFDKLPANDPDRSNAWASIEYQIRNLLQSQKRSGYNDLLTAYMDKMKAGASIALTEVDQSSAPSSN
jgi:hypothetical protein